MNRAQFMRSNVEMDNMASMGSLNEKDIIKSDSGLVATVLNERPGYYIVGIIEGAPFKSQHLKEIWFNHSLERYEIHASNIRKWQKV